MLLISPPKSPWQLHQSQHRSQDDDEVDFSQQPDRPRKHRKTHDTRFENSQFAASTAVFPAFGGHRASKSTPRPPVGRISQSLRSVGCIPPAAGMVVTATLSTQHPNCTPPLFPFEVFTIILQHVHNPGELSRLSKVCRVLHALTAPRLLKHMWIDTSSSWQFLSAISTLQNPGYANNVCKLTLRGAKLPTESEERLLMLALGALVGGMTRLTQFRWERDVPIPRNLYEALARNSALKSMVILRTNDPTTSPGMNADVSFSSMQPFILPAFRTITSLTITNIDAVRTEDWSRIALGNLKRLRLSFTTPHSQQDQPGGGLANFFRALITGLRTIEKARAAGAPLTTINGTTVAANACRKKLELEEIEFDNLFLPEYDETLYLLFDPTCLQKIALMDCSFTICNYLGSTPSSPGSTGSAENITFPLTPGSSHGSSYSNSQAACARNRYPKLKTFKTNMLNTQTLVRLSTLPPLENLYFVDPSDIDSILEKPITNEMKELGKSFLDVITTIHGKTLKRLRLSAQWVLTHPDLVTMTRSCPNLKECAWATEPQQWVSCIL